MLLDRARRQQRDGVVEPTGGESRELPRREPGEVRAEAIGRQRRGCGGQLRHAMPSGQCRRVTGGAMGRDLAQQMAKP